MEHGGRLPANCALTVYYLPVYPPYSDYNYGLWGGWMRFDSEVEAEAAKDVPYRWPMLRATQLSSEVYSSCGGE
jgi:hypothetical protein